MGDLTDADIDYFDPNIEKLRPRVALRTPLGSSSLSASRASSTLRSMRATSVAPSSFQNYDAGGTEDEFGSSFGLGSRARRAVTEARELASNVGYLGGGGGYSSGYSRDYSGSAAASKYGSSSSYNRSYMRSSNLSGTLRRDKFDLNTLLPSYDQSRAYAAQAARNYSDFWSRTPTFMDYDYVNQRQSNLRNKLASYKLSSSYENDSSDYYGKSIFDSDLSSSKLKSSDYRKSTAYDYDADYDYGKSASNYKKSTTYDYDYGKTSSSSFGASAAYDSNSRVNALRNKYGARNAATSALENYVRSAVDDSANEVIGETTLGARFDRYAERLAKNYFQRYYGGEKKFFEKQATGKRNAKFAHYWI